MSAVFWHGRWNTHSSQSVSAEHCSLCAVQMLLSQTCAHTCWSALCRMPEGRRLQTARAVRLHAAFCVLSCRPLAPRSPRTPTTMQGVCWAQAASSPSTVAWKLLAESWSDLMSPVSSQGSWFFIAYCLVSLKLLFYTVLNVFFLGGGSDSILVEVEVTHQGVFKK